MFKKVNQSTALTKIQSNFPEAPLVTIYKSVIRPQQDQGDILHDQRLNNSFHTRLESFQQRTCFYRQL